ncbi:hypothetical protein [Saccharopolyspora spinosa]|uniref:hypothetical protein n=1 Tax=Saccharopolyspora spinosa TaxID=60894 RepID=UPI000237A280|nr:hypothetical protein [Saccharopolyspora spinosa]
MDQYVPNKRAILQSLSEQHLQQLEDDLAGLLREMSDPPPRWSEVVRVLVVGVLVVACWMSAPGTPACTP